MIYSNSEVLRIQNMIDRVGREETLVFAHRTYKLYRTCIFKTKNKYNDKFSHLSLPEFKNKAILSCLQLKHFIKNTHAY